MNNNVVVGVDIGGSHITAALVDLRTHSIIRETLVRRHINAKGNTADIIKQWTDTIVACKAFHPQVSTKVGIAIPGPFDYENGISYITGLDKYESLLNKNVKQLLAQELHIDAGDIFMKNDASCFLKGEVFGGAAAGSNNVLGITLGTGLGSAVFKSGQIYEGDLFCMPYQEANAEAYVSTRWFLKEYQERTGVTLTNVKELSNLVTHDKNATFLFERFGENLGEIIALYNKKWDVEIVVIGGNIAKAWALFIPEVEKVLAKRAMVVSLVQAKLGEEGALLGAGSLCA